MYCKKIVGLFLLVSVQTHCMLTMNRLPMQRIVSEEGRSKKNYHYNKSFFQNKMIPDMQPVVMSNLDHRSNIQFIATSKHLYNRYVQQKENGGVYHHYLFTNHPFQFSPTVDFNVYFDCYSRALFHYAPHQEAQTKILLSIEDEIIQDAAAEMLKTLKVNDSNENAVMSFYRQEFTDAQFYLLVRDPAFLQAMLKRGISPNAECDKKYLVHTSIAGPKKKLLKILLADSRFDPNIQDRDGNTVLHKAVWWDKIELAKMLLVDRRIDPNIQDKDGNTVFHQAIGRDKTEFVKRLLTNPELDPNIQDKDGDTVLHRAVFWGRIEVIKMLLANRRIDPNIKDKNGNTALHRAVYGNKIEAIKMLLTNPRLDPNIQDKNGDTVLMIAVSMNKVEIVKLLLANDRVRRDIEYRPGRSAYHLARKSEIIELLSEGMSWSDKYLADIIEVIVPATFMLAGVVIYDKIFLKQ